MMSSSERFATAFFMSAALAPALDPFWQTNELASDIYRCSPAILGLPLCPAIAPRDRSHIEWFCPCRRSLPNPLPWRDSRGNIAINAECGSRASVRFGSAGVLNDAMADGFRPTLRRHNAVAPCRGDIGLGRRAGFDHFYPGRRLQGREISRISEYLRLKSLWHWTMRPSSFRAPDLK